MNADEKFVEDKLIREQGMFYLSAGESFKRTWRQHEATRMRRAAA